MHKDFPSCTVRYSLRRGSAFVLLGLHLVVIAWALLPKFWHAVWQAPQPEAQILALLKLLITLAALAGGVYWLCAGVAAMVLPADSGGD
ncbi:hypothetical protein [Conchiformibius kuhniae]|uniref:Uncharacterized protein n=1 Tax=Conchiformibius kuhniae TaxID=211502 RepID=A0A8T9MUY5_9NEIS|nr:hypothetical protein [Conchiformibius kuhniae]UOP04934.1 hypothetical protein LVJ77_00810 [Conchiformibius kuhniae]